MYAALQPGPLWSTADLFTAETLSMAVIVLIVGMCLAEDRLAPFVPWVVGILIGMAIAVLGTVHRGQREPGPPVRTGGDVWPDAVPVGISTRPDAGSGDRGLAATDDPAPPQPC